MRVLTWDIETDGLPAWEGKLLCVSWKLDDGGVACATGWDDILVQHLEDPTVVKASFTKYDPRYAVLQGIDVQGPIHDIQVMAWVLNENQMLSLDAVAKRYLSLTMDKRIKRREGNPMFLCDDGRLVPLAEAPFEQLLAYNVRDVDAEYDLYVKLKARLEESDWWDYFLTEEVPFTSTLLGMETAGLPVNLLDNEVLRIRVEDETAVLASELLAEAKLPSSFNLNSGDMLAAYLYNPVFELRDALPLEDAVARDCAKAWLNEPEMHEAAGPCSACADGGPWPPNFTPGKVGRNYVHGLWTLKGRGIRPTEQTDSGSRWSTSTPVLKSNFAAAQDPWVQKLLEYRKREKALTTYLRKFPVLARPGVPPRLYGRFNQTGTKTGRLSSSEPNLQNIPAHGDLGDAIRGLFQGDLVVGDYSQLEPRLMAHFSMDPVLVDVYTTGKDIYLTTANAIFGGDFDKDSRERGIAKTLVLAMGYGAGPAKVAQILTVNGFPTAEDMAKGYLRELTGLYNVFFAWRDEVIRRVKQTGYVTTLGGRHRRLRAAFADRRNWKLVGYGERQAVNAVVQGSAGDVVRRVMVSQDWKDYGLKLLAQVHDELVWEVEPGFEANVAWLADVGVNDHGFKLNVPLVFEPMLCNSWADKGHGIVLPDDLVEETTGYEEEM